MKKVAIILTLILLFSCSSNDSEKASVDLLGTWKLIEQLSDPGDGSGVFVPVNSNKTIEFKEDFTVYSNSTLCYMDSNSSDQSTGAFFAMEDTTSIEGTILPDNCEFSEAQVLYKIESNNLILYYLCIEPCAQKYVKIN